MQITDLSPDHDTAIQQTASIVLDCFGHLPSGYPTLEDALQQVQESFAPDRISRIALDHSGMVLGWIGGIEQYDGHIWELHPLVVKSGFRGQGIGRSLVQDLEAQVRQRGGLTLWLGTDDEEAKTTLSGVNLYPNVFDHIASIRNLRQHPYEFYQKCGFVIVGVMPDANGLGKPDIYMAKPI
ncbi:MAG: GNAT family N-acetyltransferase [Drouetiella hepatica Uher 2000/2452]|jgi:aminoglycoside 6'-N-acetyltransferase I|uniref:GNAT family N-acetyltransferase n=1 Tax=Drouetiella hepatica Uher 2000/2452 TaxID=904376 RepID=A0A951UNC5_9CYAN|nr:GNAT family N-acetyltransferase [Drouetiella hepatica Uher 2000/2452]